MNYETDVTALEAKWEQFEISCRPHVADEVVRNRVESAKQDPAALLAKYPRVTFDNAAQAFERDERRQYDAENGVAALVVDTETTVLEEMLAAQMAASEELPPVSQAFGHGQDKALAGTIVEELQLQRLPRELGTMTMTEIARAYTNWRDDVLDHRTAIRLIEALSRGTLVAKLDLQPDPERDVEAILALRKAVTARRQARVSPELKAWHARVQGTRTLTRRQFLHMRKGGIGIAMRPGLPQAV